MLQMSSFTYTNGILLSSPLLPCPQNLLQKVLQPSTADFKGGLGSSSEEEQVLLSKQKTAVLADQEQWVRLIEPSTRP